MSEYPYGMTLPDPEDERPELLKALHAGELLMLRARQEVDVLRLMARGKNNSEIAKQLVISPSTAALHVSNVLDKMEQRRRQD